MERHKQSSRARAVLLVLVTVVLALVGIGAPVSEAESCDPGRAADLQLTQTTSLNGAGNTVFTVTLTNGGPSCAPGAQVRFDLSTDYLSFTSVHPSSWDCPAGPISGPTSVTCTLGATIGVGFGDQSATVAAEASGESASHTIGGADVLDPDCAPSFYCDEAGSNNESWAALGTRLDLGPSSTQFSIPTVSIARPTSATIAGTLLASDSSFAAPPPPCDPNCVTDRQWIVETPGTGGTKDDLMTMAISVLTTSKPSKVIYQFDHVTSTWLTYGACKGIKVGPCVSAVTFDRKSGIAKITVLTPHFSHWTK